MLVWLEMERDSLLQFIETLDPDQPLTEMLENRLQIGVGFGKAWYRSQKEHWLRWLSQYDTPGAYGRIPAPNLHCQAIYNRLQCPPMVFWLGEAVKIPQATLKAAYVAATSAEPQYGRQTKAVRRHIPWSEVENQILRLSEGGATRCNGQIETTTAPGAKLQRVAAPIATSCNLSNGNGSNEDEGGSECRFT